MKDEEVWTTEYDTRAEAIEAIDAWIRDYRTERPHQSLDYLTPAEYRARGTRLNLCNPGGLKCQPPAGPLHRTELRGSGQKNYEP